MMIVRKGNVFIKKHCNRDAELKTFYFIERAWCETKCDVIIIIFWREEDLLPTIYFATRTMSDILEPPAMGSVEQGTSEDWFMALWTMLGKFGEYSKKVIEEAKE